MPKNGATGKSSKTARVLSLLTDPAASLLGNSHNNKEESDKTEVIKPHGLDDAATESRIQASLAAQEDSLVSELFGKKETPRQSAASAPPRSQPAASAPPQSQPAAQEPDPRTLELLSMLSNPSTLGNSAMPSVEERRPVTAMDFADELTAGMPQQPKLYEPEPEPEPEPPAARPYVPQQLTREPAQPPQQPQYAPQPPQQPQYAPQPPQQSQYAQPPQQSQYAPQQPQQQPQYAQPPQQSQYAPQQTAQPQPQPRKAATPGHSEEFLCFNLTQAVVESKAEKLMKQLGMCTCSRCKVDVTAIALTNLPPKYVATQNRDILPLLSMYEEKYSVAVTVQVMNACRMVMKRPHHGR